MITVVGVCGMARFGWREHQPVTAEDNKEAVTSHDIIVPIHVYHHQPKLIGTHAWILRADIPDAHDYLTLTIHFFPNVGLRLVEGLTTMAK